MKTVISTFLFFISLSVQAIGLVNNPAHVMFYNVENLFDTVHEPGKNDWAFLPKTTPNKKAKCHELNGHNSRYLKSCLKGDWTKTRYLTKINQIKKLVLSSTSEAPHFLGLAEVENDTVVKALQDALGMDGRFITESPDKRGIDVALIYRSHPDYRPLQAISHRMEGDVFKRPTRDILEVQFEHRPSKKTISFFINHWPSQGAKTPVRVAVAKKLVEVIKERQKDPAHMFVLMGDFNTLDREGPKHPFHDILLPEAKLTDLHALYEVTPGSDIDSMAPGTHFYGGDKTWNLLDRFFIGGGLLADNDLLSPSLDILSYSIHSPDFALWKGHRGRGLRGLGKKISGAQFRDRFPSPWRYNHLADSASGAGYSDHFAIEFFIR